ncbi:MAG: hypothetical protein V1822_03695 [Candidatus Micrarchaeota archaeon]
MKKYWAVLVLAGLVLFSMLPQLLHAQEQQWNDASPLMDYFNGNPQSPNYDARHDWRPWALAAIAICILANTLVYVLARAFSMPSVERFAVSEFYQVTASAIMIFVLVMVADSAFGVVELVLPQGTATVCAGAAQDVWAYQRSGWVMGPLGIVQCKLEEKIAYLEDLYNRAYENNRKVEWLTTSCVYFMSFPVYCFDWDTSLHAEMERSHYIANRIAPIAINLHGQYMFADYIAKNMLAVFLPLGILLRIFPVFRGIGGLFIAIAIAFYFVFPIAYIMLDPTTVRPPPSSVLPSNNMAEPNACFDSFSGFVDMITAPPQAISNAAAASGDPNQVGTELAKMQIEAFFYPLVSLGAAILFIVAIAPVLGGDSGNIMRFLSKVI